ncbi:hypothetical protein CJD36_006125 [Flavipsychrobacter stenotrophus]|uniref:histidine kinase n=1 Tax=Flavipsychrobacter stenotrophus TaxID=2077091 RepID=A0A2S7SXR8_9BACT|nr:7TM diverse intracellular signaling domain-containing protein [Flavipsychrobacter stenotrophus]PQJ11375.1 hypothetical protein CJD36_006125 [Flavipsychrobacter stenotrophus]
MKTIYSLVVFAVSLFVYSAAKGQAFVYTDSNQVNIVGKYVGVFEDPTNQLTFDEVRLADKFKPSEKEVPNFGITNSTYWLKLEVENKTTDPRLLLTLSYPQLDEVDFFKPDSNGAYREIKSGEQVEISKRIYSSQNFIFNLNLPQQVKKIYYFKIKSSEQILVPISLGATNVVFNAINNQDNLTSIYLGIIFVMIFYNIFVYLSVKDKSYLYYVFYILFVGLTQIGFQGYSYRYFWPTLPALANNSVILFPALTGITAIEFFKKFLYADGAPKKVNIILNLLNVFYLVNCVLSLAGLHQLSQQLLQPNAMIASFIILGLSINAIRKGSRPAIFFLVAWVTFLMGIIVFILKDVGVLPYNNFTNYILQIGSAIEVVVLSFALADKINIYRKEKEISQAATLSALKENEKIITEQNIVLEKRVDERTLELNLSNKELNKAMTELKEAETQLVESEKMASLGQLTAGIAHEINNPINFVTSNVKPLNRDVRMLLETVDVLEKIAIENIPVAEKQKQIAEYKEEIDYDYLKVEIDQLLSGIGEGASRTAEIVKGLRIFSRLDEDDLKKADINEGLESTLIIANNLLNNVIKVDKHYSNIPLIECYPGKLNQVFLNMISNAVYAIKKKYADKDGGILGIKTYIDDNHLAISISDNGTGMDEQTKKKLFEPFFTTKDVGEGTGLGLSIAYNTIVKHNGSVQINSELGQGTEFIIKLPLIQK